MTIGGIVVVGTCAATVSAGEHLRVRVTPTSSQDLIVYVGITRSAENRMLRVTAESEDFFRSSEMQLDGEESARVNVVTFRQLPAGWYHITVQLIVDTGRARDVERRDVMIM